VHFALVCLGGAVGTGARYLLGGLAIRWLGLEFPYGTLLVNVIGSFLIGLVQELALGVAVVPENVRVVLAVGLLGGFTTYSAFAYESLRLAAAGSWGPAVLYVGLTTVLCFAACLLGIGAARLVTG
jgi:CrcB protein